MGWLAPQAVRDHSKAKGAAKAVLMTIATYCDDAGIAQVTPSIKTIAEGCGFSQRCVKDALAKLKGMGELTARKEGQGFHTKVYYAISSRLIAQQRDKIGESLQEGMGNSRTMIGQLPHHDRANGSKHGATSAHINNLNKDLKEKEGERAGEVPAIKELCVHFEDLTYMSGRDWDKKYWYLPLIAIYKACKQDFEKTKRVISQAITDMKDRDLTISTPYSIQANAVRFATRKQKVPASTTMPAPKSKYHKQTMSEKQKLLDEVFG